jgi:hypothetical protein
MSCTISGRVVLPTNVGTTTGLLGRRVYLRPSRTDFQFSLDSGTTWQNWQGDPDLATTYPGAIAAVTNGAGDWSIVVPWTDNTNETRLPGGAPVPALLWNIIDPNPASGPIVYFGATKQSIVGPAQSIKGLTTLAAPDTWQVGSVTYSAVPVGPRRRVSVPFTSASQVASIVFPDIGSAEWKFSWGVESDDSSDTFYVPIVDTTSKTNTSGTLRLSDVPPAGKTVLVHVEAYL